MSKPSLVGAIVSCIPLPVKCGFSTGVILGNEVTPESSETEDSGQARMTDKQIVEITTYRKEGKYKDKRRPESVTWGKTIAD